MCVRVHVCVRVYVCACVCMCVCVVCGVKYGMYGVALYGWYAMVVCYGVVWYVRGMCVVCVCAHILEYL